MKGEDAEQEVLARWLDAMGIVWFHPPNGGARNAITGAKLKRLGVKRGVPDVVIITPPPSRPEHVGTAIELKAKGGRATREQRSWLETLRANRWYAFVAVGAGDAIAQLRVLGYGSRS